MNVKLAMTRDSKRTALKAAARDGRNRINRQSVAQRENAARNVSGCLSRLADLRHRQAAADAAGLRMYADDVGQQIRSEEDELKKAKANLEKHLPFEFYAGNLEQ